MIDFENYAASNLAGWDAEQKKIDGVRWAEHAHRAMDRMREVEQEPNMPLAHLAREFGVRGPALNCLSLIHI